MNRDAFETLSPDQERARAALALLEAPAARPEYRAVLKRAFVAGEWAAAVEPSPETVRAEAAAPSRMRWRISWRPGLVWGAAPLALAALALTLVVLDRGPRWELVGSSGPGPVVIDDQAVSMENAGAMRSHLRPGARVQLPAGSELEVASAGNLAIQVAPETDATLPASPGRWFARSVVAQVRRGEIRVTSGKRFPGARLMIVTPEARIELTGTTIAVICEPQGTCVCVHEGIARVGVPGGPLVEVRPGERRFVFNDGRPPEQAHIRETEEPELHKFRERSRALMEASR